MRRGFQGASLDLFAPHNEHWSTLPILVFRGLFSLFGVRTYLPYLAVLIVLHVAVAHLLWLAMRRLDVDPWLSTALSAAFLVLGAGTEDLTWAFQIGFVGSLAFGLAATLLADQGDGYTWRRVAMTWALSVAALMCSGIGVTMVAVAAVTAWLRHGLRSGAVVAAVPAAVYVLWFAVIGHQGLSGTPVTRSSLTVVPQYIWTGVTATIDRASGFTGAGGVIAIGILGWLLFRRRECFARPMAFAAAAGAVMFFALNGIVRASLGPNEAASPRYLYVSTALLVPVIGWMITQLARRDLLAQAAVVVLVSYIGVQGLGRLSTMAGTRTALVAGVEGQILAAAQLIGNHAPIIGASPVPDSPYARALTVPALAALLRDGDLPPISGVTPSGRLGALAALQTGLSFRPGFPPGGARVTGVAGALASVARDGCLQVQPVGAAPFSVRFAFSAPASVRLESAQAGTLKLYLQLGGNDAVTGNPLNMSVPAGVPVYLNVLVANATPYVIFPGRSFTICGP